MTVSGNKRRGNADKTECLYKEIGNADDRYVEEMLDDALAEKIRKANRRKRGTAGIICAAAAAALCFAAAYPMTRGEIEKESDTYAGSEISAEQKAETENIAKAEDTLSIEAEERADEALAEEENADGFDRIAEDRAPEETEPSGKGSPNGIKSGVTTADESSDTASEEKEIYEQYGELLADGVKYKFAGEISAELAGESLGEWEAYGFDDGGERLSVYCEVFEINGVPAGEAVAVTFDGEAYYRYGAVN